MQVTKNEWGARERDIKGTFTLNPIKGNNTKPRERNRAGAKNKSTAREGGEWISDIEGG